MKGSKILGKVPSIKLLKKAPKDQDNNRDKKTAVVVQEPLSVEVQELASPIDEIKVEKLVEEYNQKYYEEELAKIESVQRNNNQSAASLSLTNSGNGDKSDSQSSASLEEVTLPDGFTSASFETKQHIILETIIDALSGEKKNKGKLFRKSISLKGVDLQASLDKASKVKNEVTKWLDEFFRQMDQNMQDAILGKQHDTSVNYKSVAERFCQLAIQEVKRIGANNKLLPLWLEAAQNTMFFGALPSREEDRFDEWYFTTSRTAKEPLSTGPKSTIKEMFYSGVYNGFEDYLSPSDLVIKFVKAQFENAEIDEESEVNIRIWTEKYFYSIKDETMDYFSRDKEYLKRNPIVFQKELRDIVERVSGLLIKDENGKISFDDSILPKSYKGKRSFAAVLNLQATREQWFYFQALKEVDYYCENRANFISKSLSWSGEEKNRWFTLLKDANFVETAIGSALKLQDFKLNGLKDLFKQESFNIVHLDFFVELLSSLTNSTEKSIKKNSSLLRIDEISKLYNELHDRHYKIHVEKNNFGQETPMTETPATGATDKVMQSRGQLLPQRNLFN